MSEASLQGMWEGEGGVCESVSEASLQGMWEGEGGVCEGVRV